MNTVVAADFPTIVNDGVDGETVTDVSGGVLFYRAGGTAAIDLTGALQPIASGSAWTVTAGVAPVAPDIFGAGDIEGFGIGLYAADGKILSFTTLRFDTFTTGGVGTHRWTNASTYTATGKVETARAADHPWPQSLISGTTIYMRVKLVAGVLQLSYSASGYEGTFRRASANDETMATHPGTVTKVGIVLWATSSGPIAAHLRYWANIA